MTGIKSDLCCECFKKNEMSEEDYIAELKVQYKKLLDANITILGRPISFRTAPIVEDMQIGLHHIVSELIPGTQNRVIKSERCECVDWIRQILNEFGSSPNVIGYYKEEAKDKALIIILKSNSSGPPYVIIFGDRGKTWMLKTGYPLRAGRLKKFLSEWEQAKYKW